MLLRLDGVSRRFGGRTLFQGVSIEVRTGDRIALVGPNGAGKTTLARIAAGLEPPDDGRVSTARGARVRLLRQELDPSTDRSVQEEVASALGELDALETELRDLEQRMALEGGEVSAELSERYDRCRLAFEFGGGFERKARVERVLEGLGFDAEARARALSSFSGGWIMRIELAKLLVASPDVLLLDEPTNHLDLPSIEWLEETLNGYGGAILLISHDRSLLRRQARRIAELESGSVTLYDSGYDAYLAQRAERREQLLARKRAQDRRIAQTERFIERFRAKATKARQVQSRIKALEKEARIEIESDRRPKMRLRIPDPPRSGDQVLALEGIHKRYGDRVVYEGVDLLLRRGQKVALAGPNGAGKSTLLRIAAGVLGFEQGERRLGHGVEVAFYAQHQLEVLDPSRSVLEELEAVADYADMPRLRGHLGAFLFPGDDVTKRVSVLSGGEKARLALARLLLRPSNFLVLDEPTNHLDVAACEVLEEALAGYSGSLLFISHDRDLINSLATHVVEVEHGRLATHPGNYDDYRRSLGFDSPPTSGARGTEPRSVAKAERVADRERTRERLRRLEKARKRLAKLEDQITAVERELEEITWKLGDPSGYEDPERIRALGLERVRAQERSNALYAEWEELSSRIESEAEDT